MSSKPTIHRTYRVASASSLIDAVATDLTQIKREDELTDADIGAALGKHQDQAAKYRTGLAEMSLVTFLRGCERWNGRFADGVLSMIGMKLVPLDGEETDRTSLSSLTKLLLQMSVALENDDKIDDAELAAMRRSIDEAGKVVDGLRARLGPKAA